MRNNFIKKRVMIVIGKLIFRPSRASALVKDDIIIRVPVRIFSEIAEALDEVGKRKDSRLSRIRDLSLVNFNGNTRRTIARRATFGRNDVHS